MMLPQLQEFKDKRKNVSKSPKFNIRKEDEKKSDYVQKFMAQ